MSVAGVYQRLGNMIGSNGVNDANNSLPRVEFRDEGMTTIQFKDVLVDLMRPVLPLYTHVVDRAVDTQILGLTVPVSSAEGLIVMKLVAMRPQDEIDVKDILAAYSGNLDLDYIRAELETFTEASDLRRAKFESWVTDANRSR